MATPSPVSYRFGTFELQPEERRLLSGGAPVTMGPRAFDLLVTLVERHGRLITKDELLERVWPKVVVEENALQTQISALRKILGAAAIATVSGSGYRFTLNVTLAAAEPQNKLPTKHNLPQPLTSFIGREKEMAQVRLLLGRTRLLTLTGAGGCGKTRLAIQVGQAMLESHPEGVWFVDLATLAEPSLVARTVAAALGLKEQQGKSLAQTIAQRLAATRPLLVIDNAEHLAETVAALVDELLSHCERVIFLVTSRQPLALPGELAYRVPSLSVPDPKRDTTPQRLAAFDSVRLFVDRARLQRPHFVVTAEIALAVASICHQLDGIPLAIELAAPRVRSMSVEEVNRRLDQRFGLLTSGSRSALHRQRTLRAMIDWSYDLLNEAERALFCRASVFVGGWTLEAAERVCVEEGSEAAATLDLLTSLADKSLVVAEEQDGISRYRMLETVRQYARERLKEDESGGQWQSRHVAYYLAMAEEIAPQLRTSSLAPGLDKLEVEHDNMRAALAWCVGARADVSRGLRLANALWLFWWYRGYSGEGLALLVTMLKHVPPDEDPAVRATAIHAAGEFSYLRGDFESAQSFHEQSLAIRRTLGDLDAVARSLNGIGNATQLRGDLSAARGFHEEALAIWRQLGNSKSVSGALNNLANIALARGDLTAARELHEEGLAIRRELGDRWGIATSLLNLAALAREQGEYADAGDKGRESLALYRELGERRGAAYCLGNMAVVAFEQGDLPAADALNRQCLTELMELGDQWAMADIIRGLADVCATMNVPKAARMWGAVERLRDSMGAPRSVADRAKHESRVAAARVALGDDAAFDEAWRQGREMDLQQAVDYALQVESGGVAAS
jgi:non-specific serine/threonine protein kinase